MTDVMKREENTDHVIKDFTKKEKNTTELIVQKPPDYDWGLHVKQSVLDAKNVPAKENTKNEVCD